MKVSKNAMGAPIFAVLAVCLAMSACSTQEPEPQGVALSSQQLENYTIAYNVAKDEGLSDKGTLNVIMAMAAESNGLNLANDGSHPGLKDDQYPEAISESIEHPQSDGIPSEYGYHHNGDYGSMGVLQQQFPWWGDVDDLMDVEVSVRAFINQMSRFDYENMPSGKAIQMVQRSYDPTGQNYENKKQVAEEIINIIEMEKASE